MAIEELSQEPEPEGIWATDNDNRRALPEITASAYLTTLEDMLESLSQEEQKAKAYLPVMKRITQFVSTGSPYDLAATMVQFADKACTNMELSRKTFKMKFEKKGEMKFEVSVLKVDDSEKKEGENGKHVV